MELVNHPLKSNGLCHDCRQKQLEARKAEQATKRVSRRTVQRTIQQAYALITEDIDKANVQRTDLVAQAIHCLMESVRLGLAQNNLGAVAGEVAQPDKLCALSPAH